MMSDVATKKQEQRFYTGWVLVERDPEAEEQVWVAHCLDFNIVSSGRTVREAIDSVYECVSVAVCDDLNAGLDPHGRNKAESEEWDRLWKIVHDGKPVKISALETDAKLIIAAQIVVAVVGWVDDHSVAEAVAGMAPVDPDRLSAYLCAG